MSMEKLVASREFDWGYDHSELPTELAAFTLKTMVSPAW